MTHQGRTLRIDDNRDASGDAEVRRLLESAGRRPEVPAADFHRLKATARAEWQRVAVPRRRFEARRLVPAMLAAGLILSIAGLWLWRQQTTPVAPPAVATFELIRGDVWLEEPVGAAPSDGSRLAVGGSITRGVELVTGGAEDGRPDQAAVRLAAGQSVRLDSDTRIRLGDRSRIELMAGAVYIDSGVSPTGTRAVEVITPYGTVVDVGTQFEVRLGDARNALRVRVRSGSISLIRGEEHHSAAGGEALNLEPDGSVQRHSVDLHAADWSWILSAAPPIDIEGLSLAAFLEWVTTETALEVDFQDEELARSARSIELHGTIEGLRPDEALTVVLAGSGLDHRVADGSILVSRGPSGAGSPDG